jgi:hypothetical protein
MSDVGKHSGDSVEEPPRVVHRSRLIKLALGITLAIVAWGYLVSAAIHFGGQGRDGAGSAWVFMAFATIGATACLFVMLILASKVLGTLRGEVPGSRSSGGGRRAAR